MKNKFKYFMVGNVLEYAMNNNETEIVGFAFLDKYMWSKFTGFEKLKK
jgi:hypothetical protein